jgi:hypothetical protein
VDKDAWRDAALILGRLHHASTAWVTLYLERSGAPEALVDLGEPAVLAVTDVLKIGGPDRRRLAADVLGAIGGPRALCAAETRMAVTHLGIVVERTCSRAWPAGVRQGSGSRAVNQSRRSRPAPRSRNVARART